MDTTHTSGMGAAREGGLLAWQYREYPKGHRDRRNLLVHALTVPLFELGFLSLVLAPFWSAWLLAFALPAMVIPMALQGRTHRLEVTPPIPFRGPLDVVARILAEQLVSYPRYVASGGFASAWRAARRG